VGYAPLGGGARSVRVLTGGERSVVARAERLLRDCHIYVTWGGSTFHTPLLTAKMLRHGIDPAPLHTARQIDLALLTSIHLSLSDSSLYGVCKFLGIPADPLLRHQEQDTLRRLGRRVSVRLCRAEVEALERLATRLAPLITAIYTDLPTLL